MTFINRTSELTFLNNAHEQQGAQFIVVYGKRRVGKTELVKQFIRTRPSLYYLADKRNTADQLKEFGHLLGTYFNDFNVAKNGFADWVDALRFLAEKTSTGPRFTLAIDEFPYLIEADASTPSQFQKGFDEYLKQSNVMLILSGSSISMMENEVLGHRSPLYGRRTGDLLVEPMDFRHARQFHPGLSFKDSLETYAMAGGMPEYLIQLSRLPGESSWEVAQRQVLERTAFLHREAEFLLREEVKEPRTYMAILRAISLGKHKASEIAAAAGIDATSFPKYFGVLSQLRIVRKEVPVTEANPEKSKKGLYFIDDNFIKFWFRFVFPNASLLELGNFEELKKKFEAYFPQLVQQAYETVSRQVIREHQSKLFVFERLGRYWHDGKDVENTEIDFIALNEDSDSILFGETKYTSRPLGTNILRDLKAKAARVEWGTKQRKEYYALFGNTGFTDELVTIAKEEGILLIKGIEAVV